MILPRLLVGAASSGAGKTSLVLGLLEALARRGLDVRPFKTGPDYLDPALHRAVRGVPSRNLDPRLMGVRALRSCIARAGEGGDLALIEGVMGYYDGSPASSADVARLVGAPVLLALDASAAAESAAAMALGFLRYRRRSGIAAFVANRIGGRTHYEMVKKAIEDRTGLPVIGYLPSDPALSLPERHLGLLDPAENPDFKRIVSALADAAERHIDLDALLALARGAPEFRAPPRSRGGPGSRAAAAGPPSASTGASARREKAPVRVAVAMDEAFSFYYEDNLDALRDLGAELAFFSPLRDRAIPRGACAIYLGGGYPELRGPEIAANDAMRASIRSAAEAGMPIYAECGGYLYLLDEIENLDGRPYRACGLLPGRARLGRRLAALGYREGTTLAPSILGPAGTGLKGHVFHYAYIEAAERPQAFSGAKAIESSATKATTRAGDAVCAISPALALGDISARPKAGKPSDEPSVALAARSTEGVILGSVFASWLHIHFSGNPRVAKAFIASARRFSKGPRRDIAAMDPAASIPPTSV